MIRLVFIRVFLLIEYTVLTKSLKIEESLVLDLKILIYQSADEIEKIKKIKADSNKVILEAMQKLKDLSEFRDLVQQELEELKVAAQAVADIMEIRRGMQTSRSRWQGSYGKSSKAFSSISPQPPDSTWDTYFGWLSPTGHARCWRSLSTHFVIQLGGVLVNSSG